MAGMLKKRGENSRVCACVHMCVCGDMWFIHLGITFAIL